ncbi:MAG: DUF4437 domain-containing protein [Micromonosporaceae bacterium]|nr:DUF4437 domain-containing protein [Micromonosporaceae bacterium]
MRPHVELIHEDDYVWHPAELPRGEGRASERRLSVDEEDGSSSLRIDFHTDWGRGPGIHHANTEYYVLEGTVRYGGREFGKGAYIHAPKGVPTDSIWFAAGTRILHFREYGESGFDPVDSVNAPRWAEAYEDVIVLDTEAMTWDHVPNVGPMPGLYIKYLHIDPRTNFYTRLVYAEEGWSDHRLAHHPCYEEAYTISGRMTYNFGDLDPGTYFFRPARIKHGHFVADRGGTAWILRSDGQLRNWYSEQTWVRWGAVATNWATPQGGRIRWSQSSHDLADQPWRNEFERESLQKSIAFQREQGDKVTDYREHGQGTDPSVLAMLKAMDAATLQGGHGHSHDHEHSHSDEHSHDHDHSHDEAAAKVDWGADPRQYERTGERTDANAYNWGASYPTGPADPTMAPIISTLPVRSRSRGRWNGEGM